MSALQAAYPYIKIAYEEGTLFSVWGPCSDGSKNPCDCPQCKHAEKLEAAGLDYNEEYAKAIPTCPAWREKDSK